MIAVFTALVLAPLFVGMVHALRTTGPPSIGAINTAGTHGAAFSRFAENAIGTPHLLLKQGTADGQVDICGKNDMPYGPAEDAVPVSEPVGVCALGGGGTALVVGSEAIDAGDEVYTAASGKVSKLSAVAGTYYKVGRALTSTTADGDELEVMTSYPAATVVS